MENRENRAIQSNTKQYSDETEQYRAIDVSMPYDRAINTGKNQITMLKQSKARQKQEQSKAKARAKQGKSNSKARQKQEQSKAKARAKQGKSKSKARQKQEQSSIH